MKTLAALALALGASWTLAAAAQAEPLLVGKFAGTLPCADCSGIRTEITLVRKASGWAEGRYLLEETYIGRSATFTTVGDWTTLKGDAGDDNAVVYELEPDHPDRARHFLKVGEAQIRVLTRDLKPLPASLPSILTREMKGKPTTVEIDCLRGGGIPNGLKCVKAAPAR